MVDPAPRIAALLAALEGGWETLAELTSGVGLEGLVVTADIAPLPLSVLFYNTALIVSPQAYLGWDRRAAKASFLAGIRDADADVVCLCEVFKNAERRTFRRALADLYPHAIEGPDARNMLQDGGLLVLSKTLVTSHATVYRQHEYPDRFANKGALHVRVAPPGAASEVDLFFTHAQALYARDEAAVSVARRRAQRAQMHHLDAFVRACGSPERPALVVGDINHPAHYASFDAEVSVPLRHPLDVWTLCHGAASPGATHLRDTTFYRDPDEAPALDQRLDYVLLHPARTLVPIPSAMEGLRWQAAGRDASDHLGLLATFEHAVRLTPAVSGAIRSVRVRLASVRCLVSTDGAGADQVSFSFRLRSAAGATSRAVSTRVLNEVDPGDLVIDTGGPWAEIEGDPGAGVEVDVQGVEHDTVSDDDPLGTVCLSVPRKELLVQRGHVGLRTAPLMTGSGGEYAVELRIEVR